MFVLGNSRKAGRRPSPSSSFEHDLPNPHALTGTEQSAALAHISAVSEKRSAPIITEIKAWAGRQQGLPESAFRKAIKYMLDLWHGLTVFLQNPWVPLDNNLVERQIRPLCRRAEESLPQQVEARHAGRGPLLPVIETAQLRGEDPSAYLLRAANAAIAAPGTVTLPAAAE